MSNFFYNLRSGLNTKYCGNCANAKGKILKFGENAHRMLEIGIVQDELVKLGFKHHGEYLSCLVLEGKKLMIDFQVTGIMLVWQNLLLNYKSYTWQEDLLTKVKELINE